MRRRTPVRGRAQRRPLRPRGRVRRGPRGGQLPVGHAVNSDPSIDWGVERIPTVCVFGLELAGVPERGAYGLRIAQGQPIEFDGSLLSPGEPLDLVVP